jgi:hypothetical protein
MHDGFIVIHGCPRPELFAAQNDTQQQADTGRHGHGAPWVVFYIDIGCVRQFLAFDDGLILVLAGLAQRLVEQFHAALAQFVGFVAGEGSGGAQQRLCVLDEALFAAPFSWEALALARMDSNMMYSLL